jgi:hypothetical protein
MRTGLPMSDPPDKWAEFHAKAEEFGSSSDAIEYLIDKIVKLRELCGDADARLRMRAKMAVDAAEIVRLQTAENIIKKIASDENVYHDLYPSEVVIDGCMQLTKEEVEYLKLLGWTADP